MANKKIKPLQKPAVAKVVPTGPFHFKGRAFHIIFALVIIAFSFVIYGNGISNGYSLDDEFVLHGDTIVQKGFKGIPTLFKKRYAWDQKGSYGYRPVVTSSFAVENQIFGKSPHIGHVLNILLYSLLVILIFYLLRKVFYDQVGDYFLFIITAIFLTHPLHTEVVDSLKNRDTILSSLFGFFCVYAFIKCFESKSILVRVVWGIIGGISLDLGLLSKPDAYMFLAITPLVLFFIYKGKLKFPAISIVSLLIAWRICARVTKHILPHSDYHRTFIFIENPLLNSHWYQRIALSFSSFWFYVSKLIFPKDLICYYGFDEMHPHPAWADITVIMGILVAGVLVYYLYKNRKDKGVIMFSLLFFSGSIFAYVNLLRVGPGIVAERFMLLPSLGFALIITILLFHFFKIKLGDKVMYNNNSTLYLILGGVILIYSGRVIARNPDWNSHMSIYEHDARLAPRSAKLQSLLASAYMEQMQKDKNMSDAKRAEYYDKAERAYQASVDIFPQYSTSWNNLGMIQYSYHKDLKTATYDFGKAIESDGNYVEALFNIAMGEQSLGDKAKAEVYFLRAIDVNPEYYMTYGYLSRLYTSEGKYNKALELNEDALKKGHISDAIYVNIGNLYIENRDTNTAVPYFEKAIGVFNKNYVLCQFLSRYYARRNDSTKANYYMNLAIEGQRFKQNYLQTQQ
ncbi:MAG TPA: hypothetical protein VK806_03240 [Bacteroidia bacterium]|nr:hypothetical protein [Bacteroidia bacterium]